MQYSGWLPSCRIKYWLEFLWCDLVVLFLPFFHQSISAMIELNFFNLILRYLPQLLALQAAAEARAIQTQPFSLEMPDRLDEW
jgi:hypothetical protein